MKIDVPTQMMNDDIIEAEYSFWRFRMWNEGYGSYDDIAWAVKRHVLIPFHNPHLTANLRKWFIRRFGPSAKEEDDE